MRYSLIILLILCVACTKKTEIAPINRSSEDTSIFAAATYFVMPADSSLPQKIVAFAKTQIGVEYKFCSMDPIGGFDCSGFVNYVFNHFRIKVPRSSVEFTNVGTPVPLKETMPGDLILFTGTNVNNRTVGHIGIIVSNNNGDIKFIQSSSGKEYGVTISLLGAYYMSRFVKVVRMEY
jgi:cell wall-associated NlpC family hydrolase